MICRKAILAITAITLVAATGCNQGWEADYSKLGLVEVSGKVTMDGQPLVGASVMFEASDKTYSFGTTDSSGRYRLMFDSSKSGVLPGEKVVRIKAGKGGDESGGDEGAPTEDATGQTTLKSTESVPAAYNSKSDLKATVSSSATMNFSLKSDGSTKGPD